MAVQTGEGTVEIIYHPSSVPAGPRTLGGYIARPALAGQWPTVIVYGDEPVPSSTIKHLCRVFARHGIAAFAPDLTDDPKKNLSVSKAVANFLGDPTGEWSNGQLGFGLVAFGSGAADLSALASADYRTDAFAIVGAGLDPDTAANLVDTDVPGLIVVSREDESVDVDATLAYKDDLARVSFAVYPTGVHGFWNDAADGYDEERADDAVKRVIAFMSAQLPAKV